MANDKATAKRTIKVGDYIHVPVNRVRVAPHDELKSERDTYMEKWEKGELTDPVVKEELEGLIGSIEKRGIQEPALAYLEEGFFYVINGRQRRAIADYLKRVKNLDVQVPIIVIKKGDVLTLLDTQFTANKQRVEETFMSQSAYIKAYQKQGLTFEQIAERIGGVSAAWIGKIARVTESPYLADLVKSRRISMDTASEQFATPAFTRKFREGEKDGGALDDNKLKAAVEPILAELVQKGHALSRNAIRAAMKPKPKGDGKRKSVFDRKQLNKMFNAKAGIEIPLEFQAFIGMLLGKDGYALSQVLATNKNLEWIAKIDFSTEKEKRVARARAAMENAQREKEAMANFVEGETAKTTAAPNPTPNTPDSHDDDGDENDPLDWEYDDENSPEE